jgi:[acyl-carrier-protein] S-malonyltransferase
MSIKAFLFPGQGSQEIGMGNDLFKDDPYFRSLINLADEITGENLEKICLRGPDRVLMQARILQPALVCICLGYLRKLIDQGIQPDFVLGHSLGEITSLAASGVVSDEEAVRIAAKRGELMDQVASSCNGGMLAVMFVPSSDIDHILEELGMPDKIVFANDNASDQIVLSGENEYLEKFASIVAERKLGKCKRVSVIGPWHSPFMRRARLEFEEWAEQIRFKKPDINLVLNATAKSENHPTTIKHLVTWQLTSPVFWRESMDFIREAGVNTIYEVGPGRVLSVLARFNGFKKETTIYNINNLRGIESAVCTVNA